jgi:hypothetical protein
MGCLPRLRVHVGACLIAKRHGRVGWDWFHMALIHDVVQGWLSYPGDYDPTELYYELEAHLHDYKSWWHVVFDLLFKKSVFIYSKHAVVSIRRYMLEHNRRDVWNWNSGDAFICSLLSETIENEHRGDMSLSDNRDLLEVSL